MIENADLTQGNLYPYIIVNTFTKYKDIKMITHSINIETSTEAIFAYYKDIASWYKWDRDVSEVFLKDGLTIGSMGWLKPKNGPKANIYISEVELNKSFTVESKLPFCRLIFGHKLEHKGNYTHTTHSAEFVGPLSFIFRRLIGKQIDKTLPETLLSLKKICEK